MWKQWSSQLFLAFLVIALAFSGVVWAGAAPDGTCSGHDLIGRVGPNRLEDADFEGKFPSSPWQVEGDGQGAYGQQVVCMGQQSGLLTAAPGERTLVRWVQVGHGLAPGREYSLVGWVRTEHAQAVAQIGARWGGSSGESPTIFRGLKPEEGWQRVELRFVAPGADQTVEIFAGGTFAGKLWWDHFQLYRLDDRLEELAKEWDKRLKEGDPVYTGLVVDARGLDVERGMSPKIIDEDKDLVYAGIDASTKQIMARGVVSYVHTLKEALRHGRLTISPIYPYRLPLVVVPLGVADIVPRTGIVISNRDARRIKAALQNYDFLARYAVVFVIGDKPE